jgi:hypothetical protein
MANTIKIFNAAQAEEIERYIAPATQNASLYVQNIIDFSQMNHYGLVDPSGQTIMPKISNDTLLSLENAQTYGISSVGGSAQVLDFVADAFTDMSSYLQSVRFRAGEYSPKTYTNKAGQTTETFIQSLVPASGYVNPVSLHKEHVNIIYDHFIRSYLEQNNRHKSINNHRDFIKMFVNYVFSDLYTDIANINLSSHIRRSLIPIECNGITIKLSSIDTNDQAEIDEIYYGDPNFNLYASTVHKFGFYIDEKRPFMLVANLRSKKMNEYAQNRGSFLVNSTPDSGYTSAGGLGHVHEYEIDANGNGKTGYTSAGPYHEHVIESYCVKHAQIGASHKHELPRQDVFTKYYVRAQENELDRLKSLLFRMYDSYIKQSPQNIVNTFPKGALVKKARIRKPVTEKDFALSMSNQKWIRLYFDLKINEERVILKRSKYLNIVRKAQEMLKVATVQEAVEYINKEIYKRVQTLVQGPNVNSSYHNLPGSNTLKKLSEYF